MKLLDAIQQAFPSNDVPQACRKMLWSHVSLLATHNRCVDVEEIANILKIKIEHKDGSERFEGHYSFQKGFDLISVGKGSNRARERFTIAHEIGHCLLRRSFGSLMNGLSPIERNYEEKVANILAGEILMPFAATYRMFVDEKISMKSIMKVAKFFEVSRRVVLHRATELLNTTLIKLVVLPNRFKNLSSAAIIDTALYVVPFEGVLNERGNTRFLRPIRFDEIYGCNAIRTSVLGSKGRVITDFEVSSYREPIHHAELFALDVNFRPYMPNCK